MRLILKMELRTPDRQPIAVVKAATTAVCELGIPPVSKNRGHAKRDSRQLDDATLMSWATVPATMAAQPASLIRIDLLRRVRRSGARIEYRARLRPARRHP